MTETPCNHEHVEQIGATAPRRDDHRVRALRLVRGRGVVGYEADGGVSPVSVRDGLPFGFQQDHRKAELALFEVAS